MVRRHGLVCKIYALTLAPAVRPPISGGTPDSMDVDEPKVTPGRTQGHMNTDLVHEIPRMYRLLDLISEPGSVGLGGQSLYILVQHKY